MTITEGTAMVNKHLGNGSASPSLIILGMVPWDPKDPWQTTMEPVFYCLQCTVPGVIMCHRFSLAHHFVDNLPKQFEMIGMRSHPFNTRVIKHQ